MEVTVELAEKDLEQLRTLLGVDGSQLIDSKLNDSQRAQVKRLLNTGEATIDSIKALSGLLKGASIRTHELLERASITLPSPPPPPPRSPELEERIQRLKAVQANKEYKLMTANVDSNQRFGKVNLMDDFGREMQTVNKQAVAVFNTVLTVAGAFAFGFFGIDFAYPSARMDFAVKMMFGLVIATIVFFADLYFIVKNMNIDENAQLDAGKKSQ
uniref:Transmembrane protein 199 n=1 Tax=Plectus sambesii TaxID=2011161 RepID=A0A914W194_9BILA